MIVLTREPGQVLRIGGYAVTVGAVGGAEVELRVERIDPPAAEPTGPAGAGREREGAGSERTE